MNVNINDIVKKGQQDRPEIETGFIANIFRIL